MADLSPVGDLSFSLAAEIALGADSPPPRSPLPYVDRGPSGDLGDGAPVVRDSDPTPKADDVRAYLELKGIKHFTLQSLNKYREVDFEKDQYTIEYKVEDHFEVKLPLRILLLVSSVVLLPFTLLAVTLSSAFKKHFVTIALYGFFVKGTNLIKEQFISYDVLQGAPKALEAFKAFNREQERLKRLKSSASKGQIQEIRESLQEQRKLYNTNFGFCIRGILPSTDY